MVKLYKILKNGKIIESPIPGKYAGCKTTKIFGNVENACYRGLHMNPKNRVFFYTMEDAIREGYRPCKACKPMGKENFEPYRNLIPFETLEEFYNRPIVKDEIF